MTRVRVGTSGWNYTEWKGSFYPDDMKPAAMLPYYATRFGTVEVNATFYRMPTPKVVAGWTAAVPAEFTFVLKAPQRITHFARLRDVDESVRIFCDVARGLGARLGPLLFQLPPNFKKDLGRVEDDDKTTPTLATADWGYFRLRAVDYTDARLEAWVKTIRGVGAGWRDAFVFFKHEERGTGPALAQRLETLLAT